MNETDFEDRLRSHLAAKARLIEVPDHKFVQTKVVPFQPRRNRLSTLVAAAAGVAIVAVLGFGLFQATGGNDEAGILGTAHDSCHVTIISGSEGYWLTAATSAGSIGPVRTDLGQELTIAGGPPVVFRVFEAEDASDPIAETTMASAGAACSFDARVSDSSGSFSFDVARK